MKRVAVIGSGFGGLAAAIRLQSAGHEVCIFEKRELPGGRAYQYKQDGFTFDTGPTVITAPDCLRELFQISGRKMEDYVEILPINPMYRLHWEDGTKFDYTDDLKETLSQIEKIHPEDAKRYPEFLEYTKKVFEAGYEELAHEPFMDWASMLRAAPALIKLQAYRSVYGKVSQYIRSEKLREAFSFHSLLVGGNPFSASSIYTLIHYLERKWGVFYAKGGTHSMVRALCQLLTDIGGKIRYQSEIEEIETQGNAVKGLRLKSGESVEVDAVVSNADVYHTYRDLLKNYSGTAPQQRRLKKARYSMSLFLIYFGTNRKYPDLAHHNVMFGKRYKGLLDDIFKTGNLADDFSLYLHVPTRTEPDAAPEGGECFYVLSPVPHLGKLKIDWKIEGPKYTEKILSYLESHYLPDLRKSLVTQKIFTPDDFESELNAHLGSAFSLEPILLQSAYWRVHNRETHLKGLYFVGAGTHPGAGIPGVVSSAKATSKVMLQDFGPKVNAAALEQCKEMIRIGSKSFSMASRLFSAETRDAACFLYGWCRYCDDQVDAIQDPQLQTSRIADLRKKTEECFQSNTTPKENVFIALRYLVAKYKIPSHYALELIEGLVMDSRRQKYETLDDLSLYCYRVAGTVGLMMSHVMGISDEKALKFAADLGIAMQLTNIARDVMDDAEMGRIYLPQEWLRPLGLTLENISASENRKKVSQVVNRLLRVANGYYRSGNSGLKYLPIRCAFAVGVASCVYSKIGSLVLNRKEKAWDRRAVVSPSRKAIAAFKGIGLVLKTIPKRLFLPKERAPITLLWQHEGMT